MREFRVLLFAGTSYSLVFKRIQEQLMQNRTIMDVIVCDKRVKKWYLHSGVFGNVFDIMDDFAKAMHEGKLKNENPAALNEEISYEFIEHDRRLRNHNYQFITAVVQHHYSFLSDIFEENHYDFIFGEVGHLITNLLVILGQRQGIKFLWPMASFWPGRFFLSAGGKYVLEEEIAKVYAKVKEEGITKEEEDWGHSYLEKFRKQPSRMLHVDLSLSKDSASNSKSNFQISRRIIRKGITFASFLKDYQRYHVYNYYTDSIKSIVIRNFTPFLPKRLKYSVPKYEKPSFFEKYILYYLHYEPDLSTLVWAPYFKNQLIFIRNLSFSLPYGFRLYVKEHPLMKNRLKGFYEEIRKIPQVRLLSSDESSSDLLRNCALVCTITGTVGWEALLLGKPVITFGNVFYNCFKGNTVLRDWEKLPRTITELLGKKNIVTDKELVQFIVAVKRFTMPGDWYCATLPEYNKENIKQLSESFYQKMLLESRKR